MDDADAPAELVPRLPKGVSAAEFADARPAVQELILAKAMVVCADEFTASQLPLPPADVRVSLPKGVTCDDFASASTPVKQIIKAASSVTRKRERNDEAACMVAQSAAELEQRVFSSSRGADSLQDGLVAAVCHADVRSPALASKQPTRSVDGRVACC